MRHFSPKGKMPSKYTIELQQQQRRSLAFGDKRDFEEAGRGLFATRSYRIHTTESASQAQGEVSCEPIFCSFSLFFVCPPS